MEKTDSKTSVLLFVGLMLAAYFGHGMGQLFGPEWVDPCTALALVVYLTFSYIWRDNWWRASLTSVAALILALGLNYVRLRHAPLIFYGLLGVGSVLAWWVAARKTLQPRA